MEEYVVFLKKPCGNEFKMPITALNESNALDEVKLIISRSRSNAKIIGILRKEEYLKNGKVFR